MRNMDEDRKETSSSELSCFIWPVWNMARSKSALIVAICTTGTHLKSGIYEVLKYCMVKMCFTKWPTIYPLAYNTALKGAVFKGFFLNTDKKTYYLMLLSNFTLSLGTATYFCLNNWHLIQSQVHKEAILPLCQRSDPYTAIQSPA